ncbi:hypothetical protein H5410_015724 [Solanum commersonii]|uniref:Uncharacterized protein n=1 Tax=Solanum commersonii TaxID=4109 RepID=A0A9J5ZV95_SOLCO|nr:hypothetical protein H5410_015724 [Solanum commersonii]
MEKVPSRATYPVSNAFLSDTHLPHEDQPTPYPTHFLELSAIILVVLVSRLPSRASRKHMGDFAFATTNPLDYTTTTRKMNREGPLPTWGRRTPFFKTPQNPLQT